MLRLFRLMSCDVNLDTINSHFRYSFQSLCCGHADWQAVLPSALCFCLQITGFSDADTATMNIFFNVGNAVGMLTGGVLGDLFAKRSPRYARPFVNQLSMIIIAPLFFILYKALPGELQHVDRLSGLWHAT